MKEALKELKKSEENLRNMFESANDGIICLDKFGKILDVNKKTVQLFGGSKKELVGKHFMKLGLFSLKDAGRLMANFKNTLAGKETILGIQIKNKKGKKIPLECLGSLIKTDGKVTGVMVIARDVTKRKKAEDLYQDILIESEKQVRKLIDLEKLRGEFVGVAAHDLKAPLTSILGLSELILSGKTGKINKKQREYLGIIIEEVKKQKKLIERILLVSKLEKGKVKLKLKDVQLKDLIDNPVNSMSQLANMSGISISQRIPSKLPMIRADKDRIRQVICELLENAIKYSSKGDEIKVSAKKDRKNNHIVVSVKDTGIGIGKEHIDKIFNKFYQIDASLKKSEGTGLGLYICKGIIKSHKGRMWVESELGKGSVFSFSLPIKRGK